MAVDFDGMVLNPLIGTFANDLTVTPVKSQPDAAAYAARGVWEVTPFTVVMEDGAPMSSSTYKIGLRLADFTVPPVQGDQITIDGDTYTLDAPEYDGVGGVEWQVKAFAAGQETHYA